MRFRSSYIYIAGALILGAGSIHSSEAGAVSYTDMSEQLAERMEELEKAFSGTESDPFADLFSGDADAVESISEFAESLSEAFGDTADESLSEAFDDIANEAVSEAFGDTADEAISEAFGDATDEAVSDAFGDAEDSEPVSEAAGADLSEAYAQGRSENSQSHADAGTGKTGRKLARSIRDSFSKALGKDSEDSGNNTETLSEGLSEATAEPLSEYVSETNGEALSEDSNSAAAVSTKPAAVGTTVTVTDETDPVSEAESESESQSEDTDSEAETLSEEAASSEAELSSDRTSELLSEAHTSDEADEASEEPLSETQSSNTEPQEPLSETIASGKEDGSEAGSVEEPEKPIAETSSQGQDSEEAEQPEEPFSETLVRDEEPLSETLVRDEEELAAGPAEEDWTDASAHPTLYDRSVLSRFVPGYAVFGDTLKDLPAASDAHSLTFLQRNLERLIEGCSGTWSVCVINLETGEEMVINDESMPSASEMKLFIMGAVYEAIDQGELERTSELVNRLNAMITRSSNTEANQLLKILGGGSATAGIEKVNAYAAEHGYDQTIEYNGFQDNGYVFDPEHHNTTSASDVAHLLESVYHRSFGSRSVCNEVEQMMLNQATRYKIPAGLPDGVSVGNKTGETSITENDAAVVYSSGGDYVLCVFSSYWKSRDTAQSLIRKISAEVYECFNDDAYAISSLHVPPVLLPVESSDAE